MGSIDELSLASPGDSGAEGAAPVLSIATLLSSWIFMAYLPASALYKRPALLFTFRCARAPLATRASIAVCIVSHASLYKAHCTSVSPQDYARASTRVVTRMIGERNQPVLLRAYYCDLDSTVVTRDTARQRRSAHIWDTTIPTDSVCALPWDQRSRCIRSNRERGSCPTRTTHSKWFHVNWEMIQTNGDWR